jgi:uncharacterized protein (DUF362 family)
MKIHPLLQYPHAVFVARVPIAPEVRWQDYRQAAGFALQAMQVQLEGEKVVIKPNVTSGERFKDPENGITTHPGFIHGILDYVQAHGMKPVSATIVEDPRDSDDNLPRDWTDTGYDRLAEITGVRLLSPTTYTCVKKTVPNPQTYQRLNVSRLAVDPASVLINVSKLKTHNLSITSLCMKNLMGLVNVFDRHYCLEAWLEMPPEIQAETKPRREWFTQYMHEQWQFGLAKRLVDTARVIEPAVNIIEGVIGREGTGFQRGQNRSLGMVVAGVNVAAVDAVASYIMGFDPQRIGYLQLAAETGLGEIDLQRLRVYLPQEDELVLCRDVDALRVSPPFRVIQNIVEEDADLFQQGIMEGQDRSGDLFGVSTA